MPQTSQPAQPIALSPDAAAAALGISRRSLYRLLGAGAITARRAGPRTLIDAASLRRYYETLPSYVSAPIPNAPQSLPPARPTRRRGKAGAL